MAFQRNPTPAPPPLVARAASGPPKDASERRRGPNGSRQHCIKLGQRIGITSSTAARWEREGAPFPEDVDAATSADYKALGVWAQERNYKVTAALVRLANETLEAGVGAAAGEESELGELTLGLRAEMHRLEVEAALNYKRYKDFENGDPALRTSYHRVWTTSVQTLAKIAKEVPDHELEEGKVIPKAAIEAGVRRMLVEFRIAADALPFRLTSLLEGTHDVHDRQEIIEREKEDMLARLRGTNWMTLISNPTPTNEPSPSSDSNSGASQ